MKKQLLLLASLALVSVSSFGQTTLFYDNFDPASYPSPKATANVNFATSPGTITTALHTYTGVTSAVAGWFKTSGNGASGRNAIYSSTSDSFTTNLSIQGSTAAPSGGNVNEYRGVGTIAMPMSEFLTGFDTKLKSNTGTLTWSFAMRLNKSTALSPFSYAAFTPSGSDVGQTGNLSAGLILATNANATDPIATTTSATGYAVMLTGSDVNLSGGGGTSTAVSSTNLLTFGKFDGGITSDGTTTTEGTPSFTKLLSIDNLTAGSSTAISVIVTYTPSTDRWTLSVRQDLSSSLQDPLATTGSSYTTPIAVVNSEFTSQVNNNMMAYYNIGGTTGFYMDNVKVTTSATLGTAKNEIEGLKVYPNPVSNGTLFIDSSNNDAKQVTVFDLLGKQVLKSKVSSNGLDVSSLNNGQYIVRITEGGKTSSKKIVIRK